MSAQQTAKLDELFRSIPKNTGIDPKLIQAAKTELKELKFKAGSQLINHKQEPWTKTNVEKLKDDLQTKDMENLLLRRQIAEIKKGSAGNPTDDIKRPLRIKESYQTLYNTHWVHTFQFFKDKGWKEVEIIVTLQRILRASYLFCHDVAMEQLQNLEGEAFYPSASWMDDDAIINRMKKKDISKEITKLARQYQRTTAQECLNALQKTFTTYILPTFVDPGKHKDKRIHDYCDECIEVTWPMCIIDPPMVFIEKIDRGSDINLEYFEQYRDNGGSKCDYLVWPAMLLHINGPLVVKGNVQTILTKFQSPPITPDSFESPRRMKVPGVRGAVGSRGTSDPENWIDIDSDSDGDFGEGGRVVNKGVTPPQRYVQAPDRDGYVQPSTPYVQPFGSSRSRRRGVPAINVEDEDKSAYYAYTPRSEKARQPGEEKLTVVWKKDENRKFSAP